MSLAVVRCPACRGTSRVESDALGEVVACPRCQSSFVAVEEAQVVSPAPVPAAPTRRTAVARPVAPPRRRRLPPDESDDWDEPPPNRTSGSRPVAVATPVLIPDPEHDPHQAPVAGLPVSVLVGLALLPFGIPLLWLIMPMVTGQDAALSIAVPLALAVAASALCLGVVKTIDWTATTRIKGVLMLVGLAYLSAAGLYFLKKELMDKVQGFFGPTSEWAFVPLDKNSRIKMPSNPEKCEDQPLGPGVVGPNVKLVGLQATYESDLRGGTYKYWAMSATLAAPVAKPDDAWFNKIGDELKRVRGGRLLQKHTVTHRGHPGCEWEFELGEDTIRIVQVFVIDNRVYYLSAEGPKLTRDDDLADTFFQSFWVN